MPDFLHFYQEELRYLSDSGKEFATTYPDVAHYLNMSAHEDRDPYVERLFEGFSFLTARIQEKIHDDFPEFTHNIMAMLAPDFLRLFPSVAMVTFFSPKGMLPNSTLIPKGTIVLSNPKVGVPKPCKFQTTQDVMLHPIIIKHVDINRDEVHGIQIEIGFEIEETVDASELDIKYLDIYLDGDPETAWMLYYFFHTGLDSVMLKSRSFNESIGAQSVTSPGLLPSTKILAEKSTAFERSHLLKEFFCFTDKFRYIRVENVSAVTTLLDEKKFSLQFRFNKILPEDSFRQIKQDSFKLYCTPVSNIFEQQSEPIYLDQDHFEYLIHPSLTEEMEIYSIVDVVGKGKAAHEVEREYVPYNEFRHTLAMQNEAAHGFYYSVKQEDKKGGGKNTLLSIHSHGSVEFYKEEYVTVAALCTNGLIPREKILEKEICNPVPGFPDYLKFTNISRPSAPIPAVTDKQYLWKVLSHMNLTLSALCTPQTLQEMLNIYAKGTTAVHKKRIESIESVRIEYESFFIDGAINRGTKVVVVISDDRVKRESYDHLGTYYLLGTILQKFLCHFCSVQYVVSLSLQIKPMGTVFDWKPERALCHTI